MRKQHANETMSEIYNVSAPGSLMLMGEHAVLYGELALVCAITQRIRVSLHPRADSEVHIYSQLGEYHASLERLPMAADFKFVLAAIQSVEPYLTQGFDLKIEAEFSHTIGFASSAAVTVASLGALLWWLQGRPKEIHLFTLARAIIRKVQGRGSGADAAASVFGGIIAYRVEPQSIKKINHYPALTAIYSGHKTPTAEVIAKVSAARLLSPSKYAQYFKAIGQCSEAAVQALQTQDWSRFAQALADNQALMVDMELSSPTLDKIIHTLNSSDQVLAAKISGSGLGDCAIGILKDPGYCYPISPEDTQAGIMALPISISDSGVRYG